MRKIIVAVLFLCSTGELLFAQNVGIGTNTPQTKLHVNNTASQAVIRVETSASSAEAALELKTNTGSFDFLELRKWMPGSTGTIAGVPLDNLSTITTGVSAGGLLMGTKPAQPLYFTTNNLERMRITSAGNIGIGTGTPHSSAALDIHSTNKGLLIPYVELDSLKDITTIPNPATYLMVFNTRDTFYNNPPDPVFRSIRKGLHYWSGTEWVRFANQEEDFWKRSDGGILTTSNENEIIKLSNPGIGIFPTAPHARVQIITTDSFSGIPLAVTNYKQASASLTGIEARIADSSIFYSLVYGPSFAMKGYGMGKTLGGGFFYSDSAAGVHTWSYKGTGGIITSSGGKGLEVSTQGNSFFFDPPFNNQNIGIDVTSNSAINKPTIKLNENDDDYSRINFTNNNTGGHYWYIAGYNHNTQLQEQLNFGSNRFGNMMSLDGNGRMRFYATTPAGTTTFASQGKLSVPFISNTVDPQLYLLDLDSNNFCRINFKTYTARDNNLWTLAAHSNETLSSERYYLNNSRKGNIIGVSGNGVVALNMEPAYTNPDDAALQVKQLSFRDGIRLDAEANSNHWSWYVTGSGELEMYYNGALRGNYNSGTGVYTSVSDGSLKKDIQNMGSILPSVMRLRPVNYRMKEENETAKPTLGFIAQEVEALFPQLVTPVVSRNGGATIKTLNYDGFGILAIKAVQEQQQLIEEQKLRIEQLEREMGEIKRLLGNR